jgi:acetyltransferase-like isoleucine patch superfamily enzyme
MIDIERVIKEFCLKLKYKYLQKKPSKINYNNNSLIIVREDGSELKNVEVEGLNVEFYGANNLIKLYAPLPKFVNSTIKMRDNATFILGPSKYHIKNLIVWPMRSGTEFKAGKNFSCEGLEVYLHGEENLKITIGDDCMFSHHVVLQSSDCHSIIDQETNKVINKGKNLSIGNHVWLSPYARIYKGCSIPDNCVIGINSFVIKNVGEGNSMYAGIPAKMVKSNINWSRLSPEDYEKGVSYE